MKILALETTEMTGSVAAMLDDNMLAELELSRRQRSAQSLAPGMRDILDQVGWRADEVDLVAVTIGPGSFTGLRVGVTAAKMFAYATGADILGVGALESIALAAPRDVDNLSVAVDAQRGQVVAGTFRRGRDGWFEAIGEALLIDVDDWLGSLSPTAVITGPVLRKLADRVPQHVAVVDPRYWRPKASSVARLARRDYASGRRDDLWTLVPRYSRRSAAEEKKGSGP